MPLKYALYENHREPGTYIAKVELEGTMTLDDIIDVMISRNPALTREKIHAILDAYRTALMRRLQEGYSVSTPLGDIHPPAQHDAYGVDDPFSAGRPPQPVTITPGPWLEEIEAEIELVRVSPDNPTPDPEDFEDVMSETCNAIATPGGLVRLLGSRLKHDPDDAAQGVFFDDGQGTVTRVEKVMQNERAALLFMVPPTLASGSYAVHVQARIEGFEGVRVGTLPALVQV